MHFNTQQTTEIVKVYAFQWMERFAAEQGIVFQPHRFDDHDYCWDSLDVVDLKIIVLLHGHFDVTDTYPTAEMTRSGREWQSWRHSVLARLLFCRAQGVPYGV